MSAHTAIEWTDATWNPVTGCTAVSPGCDHCYARTFAERWRDVPGHYFQHGFDVQLRPDKLALPLQWRQPRRIFVNSMSDLFHTDIPDTYIARVFAVMALAPHHTFQVLTKRHARMRALLSNPNFAHLVAEQGRAHHIGCQQDWLRVAAMMGGPLPNVWLGVSVDNQQWADIRVPALLDTPATVRFLSCEPLLGLVDLSRWLGLEWYDSFGWGEEMFAALNGRVGAGSGLHWVIAGGESGPRARPMHPNWVRTLRDQCGAARIPFLFKQWGMWRPASVTNRPTRPSGYREMDPDGSPMVRVGKHAAGRELDGRTHDQFPTGTEQPNPEGSAV